MYCPKCGKENREDAKFCSFCNSELPGASPVKKDIIVKTSRLAIASFILALLSCLLIFFAIAVRGRRDEIFMIMWLFTSLAAIILGAVGLIQIGLSAGRLVATGFAVIGTSLPFFVFLLIILIAIFNPPRSRAFRMTCGSNLSGIGKAMLIYANDCEDELPRAGGPTTKWGYTPDWKADNRQAAFNLKPDRSGGQASISSSLYLLVKYAEAMPKSFVCNKDTGTTEFKLSDYPNRNTAVEELVNAWDFGPEPWKHCSYAYHIPYGMYALTASCDPRLAVAADRNPWIDSPYAKAKDFSRFKPDKLPWNGTKEQAKYGNAIAHQRDGQQVLFMDMHVDFERRSYCGIEDDNIYTFIPSGLGHPEIGQPPVPFVSQPGSKEDSLLVHDPPKSSKK